MKNFICIVLIFIFIVSCASKNTMTANQKQIAEATQRLGEEYYNAGNYTAALQTLLEAYKTMPEDPFLHNSLGLVYMAKDRYGLAENHFKKAIHYKPDYIHAKNNLGAAYLKQQKWELAIHCFEAVSENILYATPEMPLSNLGWAYFHQKMYKKSKTYFKKSLEIRPDFLIAIHGISSIYIKIRDYTQAVAFLYRELERNPGAAILHSDLAKAYEGLNDFHNARNSWYTVLKLAPEISPLSREARKRLFELN